MSSRLCYSCWQLGHTALDIAQLQVASINYRIAIGPHAGCMALALYSLHPEPKATDVPLLARLAATGTRENSEKGGVYF